MRPTDQPTNIWTKKRGVESHSTGLKNKAKIRPTEGSFALSTCDAYYQAQLVIRRAQERKRKIERQSRAPF